MKWIGGTDVEYIVLTFFFQSLERMVLDLGKDYYHLSGDALSDLSTKVKAGNMEDVLRVYESEMRVSRTRAAGASCYRRDLRLGFCRFLRLLEPGQERRDGQLDSDLVDSGAKDQSECFILFFHPSA